MRKKKFKVKNISFSEEEKAKRRAVIFGILTLVLGTALLVWGIPFFVKAIEFLGNLKSEGEEMVKEDKIPPIVPRFSFIPEATNSATLSVSGFSEPKAGIKLVFNDQEIDTDADEEGNFSISKLNLDLGENSLLAWAEDESENQSEKTETFLIVYDSEAPGLEIEAPEDKSSAEEQTIEVRGKTESEVRVLINEHIVIVDEEGGFSTKITLKEGGNKITITAEDKAGNQTKRELSVTYLP